MVARSQSRCVLISVVAACAFGAAHARSPVRRRDAARDFALLGSPLATPARTAPAALPASLAGGTVAALDEGALVIEPDSGQLVATDRQGKPRARLDVGAGAGLLVLDATSRLAYVADRAGDRVVVVDTRAGLRAVRAIATRAEPYGLALTPDRRTLLVTTIADHALSAYEAPGGAERWSIDVGPEPRGVAIAPSGKQAVVTSLATGALTFVDLEARSARWAALEARAPGLARNAWAALYLAEDTVVAPHQISIPRAETQFEERGSYGGGAPDGELPVAHRLTFVSAPAMASVGATRTTAAEIALHQPRALAWDGAADVLYVAGYGNDTVVALADASQPSIHLAWTRSVRPSGGACGPSGLAVRGQDVVVFCELGRRVLSLRNGKPVALGPEVAPSRLSAIAQRGRVLFHRGGDARISGRGALACASCHPEGRADGLSWRIEGHELQTPILAGRLAGTHPFKWDGKDPTLAVSLKNTVQRLGGGGLTTAEVTELDAYLASLPRPRAPTARDAAAVARGKALFEADAGCAGCHDGPRLTNGKRYDLARDLERVDTPSLVGVAASAPYYHDGSAATLRALLLGNASVHAMGQAGQLEEGEVNDLVAYLQTL